MKFISTKFIYLNYFVDKQNLRKTDYDHKLDFCLCYYDGIRLNFHKIMRSSEKKVQGFGFFVARKKVCVSVCLWTLAYYTKKT